MADSPPTTTGSRVASSVGTFGVIATALAALTLAAVLIGNLLVLVFKVHTALWLAVVVDVGPVVGLFLSNIGNGVNYYGAWRVLRGLDEYDVKADSKNQLQNVPGMVQWVPEALAGCFPLVAAGLLAVSLIISVLTLAPAPVHTLGIALQSDTSASGSSGNGSGNQSGGRSGGTQGGSSGGPQGNTNGPVSVHFAVTFGTNYSATQQCDAPSAALAPLSATLDNTGSTSAVRWELTNVDTLPGTTPTGAWANASGFSGTIAAGQTSALTLTPDARLCSLIPRQGNTYHVTLQVVGIGVFTLADQVGAPPHLALALNSTTLRQTCPSFYSALSAVSVTLDNAASNVAATWQLSGMQKIPGTSHAWASPSASSGSVAAGQKATLALTPDPKLCYWNPLPGKVYHVTLSWNGGQSVTITDTIISPPLPNPPPPPPSPAAMWLGATPLNNTQACSTDTDGNPTLDSYQVTLVNSGSYAINWTFSATQPVSATNSAVWATASPASGSVPAGGKAEFTVTPDAGICAVPGNPSYAAKLTQSGNGAQGPTQTLTDGIGVPNFASFTLTPNPEWQECGEGVSSYEVTLANTAGAPFKWTIAPDQTVTGDGGTVPWATFTSDPYGDEPITGGTLGAHSSTVFYVNPTYELCFTGGSTTYTATISATSPNGNTAYGSQTLKDTITVPVSLSLAADPTANSDYCNHAGAFAPTPYPVTLTNNSNVPVTWSFASVDQITVEDTEGNTVQVPWASFAGPDGRALGTLAPGASTTITVTPLQDENGPDGSTRGVCHVPEATYSATVTGVDTHDTSQSATTSFTDTFYIPG